MYQISLLQKAFAGLVGFRPIELNQFDELPASLLQSSSGLYADAHPILNYQTIIAALPKESSALYRTYDAGRTYGLGDVVRSATSLFRSKKAQNSDATSVANSWERTSHVAEQLRRLYESAVQKMISELFVQKKLDGRSKQVVQDTRLFYSVGNRNDLILKQSRFVGVEFVLKDLRDLSMVVNEIGLHASRANTDLPLYIYDSTKMEPVNIIPLNTETGYQFSWSEVEPLSLKENINGQHAFIIGYYEDDLTGQAIDIAKNWMKEPCSKCNQQDPGAYRAWSPYVEFHPFSVDQNSVNEDRTMFSMDAMDYNYKTNFGLNFRMGVKCDVTDAIIRQKFSFATALQRYLAVELLSKIGFNTEVNSVSEQSKAQARYLLDPGQFIKGFRTEAVEAIKALDLDFSTMTSVCLQGHKNRGIKTGAA